MMKIRDSRGFTLMEIVAILTVIGIVVVAVIIKTTDTTGANKVLQVNLVRNHLRYAQSMAMKRGEIWGIKCNGTDYWLFRTNAPDTAANQIPLPDENGQKVTLADKQASMTAFTVFFDTSGIPYTAYTSPAVNPPVSAGNPLSITVDSIPGSAGTTFGVAPETGFIP